MTTAPTGRRVARARVRIGQHDLGMTPTAASQTQPSEPSSALFTTRQGYAAGLTRSRMRAQKYIAPFHGVRAEKPPETLIELFRAGTLALPQGSAVSHVSALRILGIEVPWRLADDDRLHLVSRTRSRRRRRQDFVAHLCTQPALDLVEVDGLFVTSPAQTWLHLSNQLLPDDVVVLADAMMRRKNPHTDVAKLRKLLEATHKMRGLTKCREALELARPGTDSSMETRTRLLLDAAGIRGLEVNLSAHDADGNFLALPDLSIPELKIAIEYDGDVHRTDEATWRRDVERRQRLRDAGWHDITATADDVIRDPSRLIARTRAAVAKRRRTLPEQTTP